MDGRLVGSLIGAVFGLVYVMVNAGSLPVAAGSALRILGGLAFLAVVVALVRNRGTATPGTRAVFPRAYWLVVLAEVVALFGGLTVLDRVFGAGYAGVAWVSFVVGVHFFALAAVFGLRFFHVLAAAITACGVAGLALAAAGAGMPAIATVAGIVPGAVLLVFAFWGVNGPARSGARAR